MAEQNFKTRKKVNIFQLPAAAKSAVEDHVFGRKSADEDHVLNRNSGVEDLVFGRKSDVEDHVLSRNSSVEDHVFDRKLVRKCPRKTRPYQGPPRLT